MATATKPKTTAKKPATAKSKAKTAPKTTAARKPAAQKPANSKPAAKSVERTVKTVVVDSAYATVGLTDTAVAVLKSLPAKAAELREEAPVTLKSLRDQAPRQLTDRLHAVSEQGKATVEGLRTATEQQLDSYATRGRTVVGKVRGSAATKKALEQSRIARSQVKAAATSVRKAVSASADAVESAADKAGNVAASA